MNSMDLLGRCGRDCVVDGVKERFAGGHSARLLYFAEFGEEGGLLCL